MGPLLYRYILAEISVPFVFSLMLFSFLLFLTRMLKLIEPLVNYNAPVGLTLRIAFLTLPTFLEITIPIALLLGMLLACGRLAEDGELTALKSAGQTTLTLSQPILLFSAVIFIFTGYLIIHAGPRAQSELKESLFSISKSHVGLALRDRTFFDRIPNLVFYVDEFPSPGNTMKGILIGDSRDQSRPSIIIAKTGLLFATGSQLTVRLIDGTLYSVETNRKTFQRTNFNVYDFNIDLEAALAMKEKKPKPSELSVRGLIKRINSQETVGNRAYEEEVELHRRFAFPFVCLIFALAAICFGLLNTQITRPRAAVTGLGIIALYYISYAIGQAVASRGFMPAFVGAWLPNLFVGGIVAAFYFSKTNGTISSFRGLSLQRPED